MSPGSTPKRRGESSAGSTKKSCLMRASSGRTAPNGPAGSNTPTIAATARSITCSTTARRAPPLPRCKLTYTRSPGMASRMERDPRRYTPSAVSTSARASYTRTVPVSPGSLRDRAGPRRPFFDCLPLPMHSFRLDPTYFKPALLYPNAGDSEHAHRSSEPGATTIWALHPQTEEPRPKSLPVHAPQCRKSRKPPGVSKANIPQEASKARSPRTFAWKHPGASDGIERYSRATP